LGDVTNKTNKIYHFLGKEFVVRRTNASEGFAIVWVAMAMTIATLLPLLWLLAYIH
jgi:hypothetical protein